MQNKFRLGHGFFKMSALPPDSGRGSPRRVPFSSADNQHAESAVVQDAFDHFGKRRIDGVKALSNKAGGRRLSRPNEIAVPAVRYVSDVVTRWRRHHQRLELPSCCRTRTCSIKPSDGTLACTLLCDTC